MATNERTQEHNQGHEHLKLKNKKVLDLYRHRLKRKNPFLNETNETNETSTDYKEPSQVLKPISPLYLKSNHIKIVRDYIAELQESKCAICSVDLKSVQCALDHQHKCRREPCTNGLGCIRGVLCRNCNLLEGKIYNNTIRYGRSRHDIPHILRRTAAYLEEGYYDLIHPSEKPKPRVLSKRQFNTLIKRIKEHNNNNQLGQKFIKLPTFPKKKRPTLTKKLEKLYIQFHVNPFL